MNPSISVGSENYAALVTRITAVDAHPNADRLQLADVSGYQVIVDKTYKVGDRVVFFCGGTQLDHGVLSRLNLYRKSKRICTH